MANNNLITVPYKFTPRPYQLALFRAMDGEQGKPETRKKRAFLRWHRRAGKDKACINYMFKEMINRKGIYYYFLPTYQQGRKIVWEGIDKDGFKLLDHMPKELVARLNNQEMVMETVNGSVFRVIGTDNIDTIVGTNPVGCVFSEYSLQDPQAWVFIRPILAENGGWAIFNGTPRGRNHMYELDNLVKNLPNWYYSEMQTLWPDKESYTGIVSQQLIQEERDSGMDEATIEQEFGVSYAANVKGAFYAEHIDRAYSDGRISDYAYDDNRKVDTFWDLGYDDSTAVWFRQVINNKIVFIDYYEASGKDLQHYVKMLEEKGYNYGTHHLPHDARQTSMHTGRTTADMFQDMLRSAKISDDVWVLERLPVQDGIQAVRSRFSRYCFDRDKCLEGIRKLEMYHRRWDSVKQVFLKEPVHDGNSHAADALRMEAIAEDPRNDGFFDINKIQVRHDYNPFD